MIYILSFLLGVLIGDIWFQSGIWLIILLGLIVSVYPLSFRAKIFSFVALCIGYGFAYNSLSQGAAEKVRIGDMVGWEATSHAIAGTAQELMSVSEFAHKYRITLTQLDEKNITPFDIILSLPPNLSLTPGDEVTAVGKFSFPRDTGDYLAEKQLWYRGMVTEFRPFHTEKKIPQEYGIFVRVRQWFDTRLTQIFPQKGHDILAGILLGQRTTIDSEMKDSLKASGLMHIMVVSGSNVMMLIIFLSLFLRVFHPVVRSIIIACSILAFVILVGGDMPVWRAALMGVIGYSVSLWGYSFAPLLLPLIVAAILALINPLALAYDIGFQLSLLSVVCIITFGKRLTKFFHFLGAFFDEAMSLTIAATLGTLPITLFYFGTFSLVGPVANLFAAPAIPLLMYGGILTLFVSYFSSSLAYFVGYIPWIGVTYLTHVITFFGNQRWSLVTLELEYYRDEFIFASLFILIIFIIKFSIKNKLT